MCSGLNPSLTLGSGKIAQLKMAGPFAACVGEGELGVTYFPLWHGSWLSSSDN